MLITINEVFGIAAVTLVVGFIISGYIQRPKNPVEMLYRKPSFIDWEDMKFAMIVSGPAIILHELGHKFMGMLLGLPAAFHALWSGLAIGVVLRMIGSPFLVLAPAYVSFPSATASNLQMMLIAFAGPFVNLVLWLSSAAYIKYHKGRMSRTKVMVLLLTKRLNMILFIFNMIPIPPIDGFSIFSNLYYMLV
ncbi:MAG: hypothetical protein AABY09_04100 [Nanoarchaeota archaeon]